MNKRTVSEVKLIWECAIGNYYDKSNRENEWRGFKYWCMMEGVSTDEAYDKLSKILHNVQDKA